MKMNNNFFLFEQEIKNTIILHIPHSKTEIPILEGFNIGLIESESRLLVDHATDLIFNIDGVEKLIFPYNRIFCDVERLDDKDEPLFNLGRGFFYTKTDDGQELRQLDLNIKKTIKEEYYDKHHQKLNEMVQTRLDKYNSALIIDCHSFTDNPFNSDLDKEDNRPDICLGVDQYHTPKWLIKHLERGFENFNLSVKINSPYSGTIIPLNYYQNDKRVEGVMIEINRKLYMDHDIVNNEKVGGLNKMINSIIFNK